MYSNLTDAAGLVYSVAVALGSNLGDRFANIERALRLIDTPPSHYGTDGSEPFASVINTSFMYETVPMYVTDQPKFINCTCLVIDIFSLFSWI